MKNHILAAYVDQMKMRSLHYDGEFCFLRRKRRYHTARANSTVKDCCQTTAAGRFEYIVVILNPTNLLQDTLFLVAVSRNRRVPQH